MNWNSAQLAEAYRRQGLPNPVASACAEGPVRSKYGAKKTVVDSITFDSKAEADTYQVLKIAQGAGIISGLSLQPAYVLQEAFTDSAGKRHRAIKYLGDFAFTRNGKQVCVDVKGVSTRSFKIKWKLAKVKYEDTVFEIWSKAGQVR